PDKAVKYDSPINILVAPFPAGKLPTSLFLRQYQGKVTGTSVTIYIDDAVLNEFRARAERTGAGYQTMMNEALSNFLEKNEKPVTAAVLRQIIREELPEVSRLARRSTGRAKTTRR
ncbi:MAG: BrnA antitoxin family protein, partial [Gammaproteobacteria bacterium]